VSTKWKIIDRICRREREIREETRRAYKREISIVKTVVYILQLYICIAGL